MLNNKDTQARSDNLAQRTQDTVLEGRSLWQDARRRFFRNTAAVASLFVLFLIVLFITFIPSLMPFSYDESDWNMMSLHLILKLSTTLVLMLQGVI